MAWICPICGFRVGRGRSVTAKGCRKCGALLVGRRRLEGIRQGEAGRHAISRGRRGRTSPSSVEARIGVIHG